MNTPRIFNVNSLNNTLSMSENSYFTSIVNDQNTMLYSLSNKDINSNNISFYLILIQFLYIEQ